MILMQNVTRHWIMTALFCAGLVVATIPRLALAQAGSAGGSIGNEEKSLSGTREARPKRDLYYLWALWCQPDNSQGLREGL